MMRYPKLFWRLGVVAASRGTEDSPGRPARINAGQFALSVGRGYIHSSIHPRKGCIHASNAGGHTGRQMCAMFAMQAGKRVPPACMAKSTGRRSTLEGGTLLRLPLQLLLLFDCLLVHSAYRKFRDCRVSRLLHGVESRANRERTEPPCLIHHLPQVMVPSIVEHLCPRGGNVSPLLVLVYFQMRFGNHHVVIRPVAEDIERLSQSLPACAPQSSADHLDPILPPTGIGGGLHQCRPCHDNNSEQAKQSRDPRFCKGAIPSPPHEDVWVMYCVLRPPGPHFLTCCEPEIREAWAPKPGYKMRLRGKLGRLCVCFLCGV